MFSESTYSRVHILPYAFSRYFTYICLKYHVYWYTYLQIAFIIVQQDVDEIVKQGNNTLQWMAIKCTWYQIVTFNNALFLLLSNKVGHNSYHKEIHCKLVWNLHYFKGTFWVSAKPEYECAFVKLFMTRP